MPLDPRARAMVEALNGSGLALRPDSTPEETRALMVDLVDASARRARRVEVHRVDDRHIPGPGGELPVRVYRPSGGTGLPVLVWFHGGGWVLGGLDSHEELLRPLVNATGCVVVSVDYRLAPEHRFPAAVDDAFAAVSWVHDHAEAVGGDPERVAVGGDSAGGNLAAVVSLMARDRGGPPVAFQLLVYPVTDHEFESASMRENRGYFLEADGMRWFYRHYLGDADPGDWRVSPLRASDLGGLPPALVITAELDPLRDQGEAYGRRLGEAGVAVDVRRYDGMFHGFLGFRDVLEPAREAFDDVAVALRRALGS
ncbi:MAG: alpha/beta hydrolase [Acidimicrobiia bacterium]|nr:alpha/beta hydrolase [Acidimicrobiia bacterium]